MKKLIKFFLAPVWPYLQKWKHSQRDVSPEVTTILNSAMFTACDVGGACGLLPHWQKLIGSAKFVVYEPHPESAAEIRQLYAGVPAPNNLEVVEEALSETGGNRTLYVTNVPTGSSIQEFSFQGEVERYIDRDYIFPIKELAIQTQNLSDSLVRNKVGAIDAIKLDVQGAEFDILKGLNQKDLGNLLLIEMELGLVKYTRAHPNPSEVLGFLEKNGFALFDLRVARAYCHPTKPGQSIQQSIFGVRNEALSMAGRAWELDIVAIRPTEEILKLKDANRLRKLIVIFCIYHLFTEAYSALTSGHNAGLFKDHELTELLGAIKSFHKKQKVSILDFKNFMSTALYKIRSFFFGRPEQFWARYLWTDHPNS